MTNDSLKESITRLYAKRFNVAQNAFDIRNHMNKHRNMVLPGVHDRLQLYVQDFRTILNNIWLTTPVKLRQMLKYYC